MIRIEAQSTAIRMLREKLSALLEEKQSELLREGIISKPAEISLIIAPPLDGGLLGFFDSKAMAIVISEEGCRNESDARNILLHELAHCLDYLISGHVSGHTPEFRRLCGLLGADRDFSKSHVRTSISKDKDKRERIRKLMALSSSPFENEAAEAIKKAQKLMMESGITGEEPSGEVIYTADLLSGYRLPGYAASLLAYLRLASGVYALRWQGADGLKTVRIHGSLAQTELAVYIFTYLMESSRREIARLRQNGERISSSSFMLGAVSTLSSRLDNACASSMALVCQENERKAIEMLYSDARIIRRRTSMRYSSSSYSMGSEFGSSLNVPSSPGRKLLGS